RAGRPRQAVAASSRRGQERDRHPGSRSRRRTRRRRRARTDRSAVMSGSVLVVVEHDRGTLAPATLEALTAARPLGAVDALTIGEAADALAAELATHGVARVHRAHDPLLDDY